jgi:hypothetical protein
MPPGAAITTLLHEELDRRAGCRTDGDLSSGSAIRAVVPSTHVRAPSAGYGAASVRLLI